MSSTLYRLICCVIKEKETWTSMSLIALVSTLVPQFCRWRCIVVFSGQSNSNCALSCLLFNGSGNNVTDRPLTNEIVPINAAKDEYRPERYSPIICRGRCRKISHFFFIGPSRLTMPVLSGDKRLQINKI